VVISVADGKPIVPLLTPVPATLNIPLLNRLRAAEGEFVPLGQLGPDLACVRDDLDALAKFGFAVEFHPYRGAAYRGPAHRLCPDQIEHGLATKRIGQRVAVWNRVTSTNDLAARAGISVSNDGLVILAEEQSAGRGRRGRHWTAPAHSSILMSVVLFPPSPLAHPESAFGSAWLTALAAVATADLVSAWTRRDARIKWPNDVRVDGHKIAGILVERVVMPERPNHMNSRHPTGSPGGWGAVIGIGLNVNLTREMFPADLATRATSMQIEAGGDPFDRSEVARDLIRRLDYWYDLSRAQGIEILNPPWQARSEHVGKTVRVATSTARLSGRLVAVDLRHGVTLAIPVASAREMADGNALEIAQVPIADILTLEGEPSDSGFYDPLAS
jgi:BirA family transcriptional regulator, biotin operon repressor / biotin---[acetyl-CoA-carboxylase] ligase